MVYPRVLQMNFLIKNDMSPITRRIISLFPVYVPHSSPVLLLLLPLTLFRRKLKLSMYRCVRLWKLNPSSRQITTYWCLYHKMYSASFKRIQTNSLHISNMLQNCVTYNFQRMKMVTLLGVTEENLEDLLWNFYKLFYLFIVYLCINASCFYVKR